jgi:hypothetical protein
MSAKIGYGTDMSHGVHPRQKAKRRGYMASKRGGRAATLARIGPSHDKHRIRNLR